MWKMSESKSRDQNHHLRGQNLNKHFLFGHTESYQIISWSYYVHYKIFIGCAEKNQTGLGSSVSKSTVISLKVSQVEDF